MTEELKSELLKLSRINLRKSKQSSVCELYDEAFIKGYQEGLKAKINMTAISDRPVEDKPEENE